MDLSIYRNTKFGSRQSVSVDVLISKRRRKVCSIKSFESWGHCAAVSGDPTALKPQTQTIHVPPFQSRLVTQRTGFREGRNCTSSKYKVALWNSQIFASIFHVWFFFHLSITHFWVLSLSLAIDINWHRDKAKIMNCDYQKLYRNHLIRTYELELEAILREKYLMINSVVEFQKIR